jgi:hypothetical protein
MLYLCFQWEYCCILFNYGGLRADIWGLVPKHFEQSEEQGANSAYKKSEQDRHSDVESHPKSGSSALSMQIFRSTICLVGMMPPWCTNTLIALFLKTRD